MKIVPYLSLLKLVGKFRIKAKVTCAQNTSVCFRRIVSVRIIVLIAFILSNYQILSAQDINKLDERNGFKGIQLGSSLENIKKQFKVSKIKNSNSSVETYALKDLTKITVLEVQPLYVNLVFFNKMLLQISVKMPDQYNLNDDGSLNKGFHNLKNKAFEDLLSAYGRNTEQSEDKLKGANAFIWRGKKVTLFYTGYGHSWDERGLKQHGFEVSYLSIPLYSHYSKINPDQVSEF